MRAIRRQLLTLLFALLWGAAMGASPAGAQQAKVLSPERLTDYVAASVNDEAITASRLEQAMREEQRTTYNKEARQETLHKLIERRLILQSAKEFVIVTDSEVEAELESQIRAFTSRERFLEDLAQRGVGLEELRERIRNDILVAKFVLRTFRSVFEGIRPGEVEASYQAHPERFLSPAQYRIERATVPIPVTIPRENGIEQARVRAQELRDALASGETTFEALGNLVQTGVPALVSNAEAEVWKRADQLDSRMKRDLESLPVNELSGAIRTDETFEIFRIIEKRDAAPRPYTEVALEARQLVENERLIAAMDGWVAKRKAESEIRILDPQLTAP